MLLGFAMEHAAGDAARSAVRSRGATASSARTSSCAFGRPPTWRDRTAPTENTALGEERRGEVHDENARALGGVAAHAGLFGTAAAVGACARWWMQLARAAAVRRRSPRCPAARARSAWDTMLPTSSCGTKLSASAIGHTGFTGTSLWIDPAKDLYVVILSNRVHPTRDGRGNSGRAPRAARRDRY